MRNIYKFTTAIGIVLILASLGTSDYYLMELHTIEPSYIYKMMVAGVILMIPAVVHIIRKEIRKHDYL